MTISNKKQWLGAITFFTLVIYLLLDVVVYGVFGPEYTISYMVYDYLGTSEYTFRTALFGFLCGALFNHFTGWHKTGK